MSHRIITGAVLTDTAEIRGVQLDEVLDLCHISCQFGARKDMRTLCLSRLAGA